MIVLLLILLFPYAGYAAEVGIAQSTAPTTNGGTQDFVVSGFGTPKCALFFASLGTANGVAVTHAMLSVGFTDFTNEQTVSVASESGVTTSDTGGSAGNSALRTISAAGQSLDGSATASTIANGARLTWSDPPPAAYLVNAVLFGGTNISNCAVGATAGSATLNGTTAITAPGFQPDMVIAIYESNATANSRMSMGIAVNDASTIVQYATGLSDANGVTPTQTVSTIRSSRLVMGPSGSGIPSLELTSFDTNGFTVTTRDAAGTVAIRYLALKFAGGKRAKLLLCQSPTSATTKSCNGTGWTPQAGIMLLTELPSIDGFFTADDGETIGISAVTASAAGVSAIYSEDNAGTSIADSVSNTIPVHLRKHGSDLMTATLAGFHGNGADFTYSVAPTTERQQVVLFIEGDAVTPSAPAFLLRRRRQ